eukprot:scaffold597_cov55-Phaeocystis_antarctica.AAC.3
MRARGHEGTLTMLALWLRASSPPSGGRPLAWTSSGAIPRSTTPLFRTGWHPATRGAGVALGLHSGVALGLQREAVRSQSALQPKQKGREVANVARPICAHRRLYTGHRPVQQRTGGIDTRARGFWVTTWDPFENNVVPLTLPSLVCPHSCALALVPSLVLALPFAPCPQALHTRS